MNITAKKFALPPITYESVQYHAQHQLYLHVSTSHHPSIHDRHQQSLQDLSHLYLNSKYLEMMEEFTSEQDL